MSCLTEKEKAKLSEAIQILTPMERDVVKLRFGLDDGYERTLEEVAHIFETTRERVRQIEAKALKKLRAQKKKEILEETESKEETL